MRPALLLGSFLILASIAACGGSSSETPWPVEPEGPALGPAGEGSAKLVVAPADLPDAGRPENRAE
ncbi:MAG: hypothetical protein ABI193_11965 [Minicystis sp.]